MKTKRKPSVPVNSCRSCRAPLAFDGMATKAEIKTLASVTPLSARVGYCISCWTDEAKDEAIYALYQRLDIVARKLKEVAGKVGL